MGGDLKFANQTEAHISGHILDFCRLEGVWDIFASTSGASWSGDGVWSGKCRQFYGFMEVALYRHDP